jgi:hypothetical protein
LPRQLNKNMKNNPMHSSRWLANQWVTHAPKH